MCSFCRGAACSRSSDLLEFRFGNLAGWFLEWILLVCKLAALQIGSELPILSCCGDGYSEFRDNGVIAQLCGLQALVVQLTSCPHKQLIQARTQALNQPSIDDGVEGRCTRTRCNSISY